MDVDDATTVTGGAVDGGLRYGSAPDRRRRIVELVEESVFRSVAELAEHLGVSDMTIRRDLRALEEQGVVRSVHGGALIPSGSGFGARVGVERRAKQAIARRAVADLDDDVAVAIDAGTTALEVAVALPEAFTGTVVTHSVPVIAHLLDRPRVAVLALGGQLLHDSQALVGAHGVTVAADLRVRRLYLGVAAMDERGVYVAADAELATKQALLDIADEVVLVADHTKFQRSAPVLLTDHGRIDVLVTDRPPAPSLADRLGRSGVEVRLADPGASRLPAP